MSNKINNQEIEELEREFEKKLIGHIKPINESKWVPYNKFIKKIKVVRRIN